MIEISEYLFNEMLDAVKSKANRFNAEDSYSYFSCGYCFSASRHNSDYIPHLPECKGLLLLNELKKIKK